jgi:opine dehydrogenase
MECNHRHPTHHRILGPKKQLWVATYPVEAREATAREVEAMFDIPCQTLPNFLNLTLTPSNQVGGRPSAA